MRSPSGWSPPATYRLAPRPARRLSSTHDRAPEGPSSSHWAPSVNGLPGHAGASVYALAAALGAPSGISQAAAFSVVVAMRLAALRWGLQTPLPADLGQKLTARPRRAGHGPPPDRPEDEPGG